MTHFFIEENGSHGEKCRQVGGLGLGVILRKDAGLAEFLSHSKEIQTFTSGTMYIGALQDVNEKFCRGLYFHMPFCGIIST